MTLTNNQKKDMALLSPTNSLYHAAVVASAKTITEVRHQDAQDKIFERANEIVRNYLEENCNFDEWESIRQEAITHIKRYANEQEHTSWSHVLLGDSKHLWNKIDWKFSFVISQITFKPSVTELTQYFQVKGQCRTVLWRSG